MANSTDGDFSVAPSRIGSWILGAALLLVALGWFAVGEPLTDNWVDSNWMLAVPLLWLAGLIWKGARRS
ncbi:MAG: hypothetical protein H7274_21155 [Rhodoferax sp.]|nr:hypothetical protein [Rhodoferax sp.]